MRKGTKKIRGRDKPKRHNRRYREGRKEEKWGQQRRVNRHTQKRRVSPDYGGEPMGVRRQKKTRKERK